MVADLKPVPQDVRDQVFNVDFWRAFAPQFSISDKRSNYIIDLKDQDMDKSREKLIREGYVHFEQPGLNSPLEDMRTLFSNMVDKGVPTVFAFLYDEFWFINAQIQSLITPLFDYEEYAMLPDFWGWHVAPGQSGWKPHRDKNASSLYPDLRPKSLTVWIPLTVAHPLNGCMSLLPAHLDSNYGKFHPGGGNMPPGMQSLADIRALPAQAGDVFAWTQNVFHWGGHSAAEHHLGPRMSVAFEYQLLSMPAWNKPLMPVNTVPTFEQRLALIAKQVKQYRHMYKFGEGLIEIADSILEKHELPESLKTTAA